MANSTRDDRHRRYAQVLDAALARDRFTVHEVRLACPEIHAATISRVLKLLEREQLIRRSGSGARPEFTWQVAREDFSGSHWLESNLHGAQIPHSPKSDRPRERLLAHGAASLRTAELLAILVRSGRSGESALQAGEKIAARYADQFDRLAAAGRGELQAVSPAVGQAAYCQIMAGVELGRRAAAAGSAEPSVIRIRSTSDALAYCRRQFARLAADARQEELHVVTLNTQLEVIGTHCVTVGLLDSNTLHPREVFRPAIADAAKAILVVHNHPSGNPTPSSQDLAVTDRLEQAARTVDIQLVDHIIVAGDSAVSIAEARAQRS